jgi:hypothetical protein
MQSIRLPINQVGRTAALERGDLIAPIACDFTSRSACQNLLANPGTTSQSIEVSDHEPQ